MPAARCEVLLLLLLPCTDFLSQEEQPRPSLTSTNRASLFDISGRVSRADFCSVQICEGGFECFSQVWHRNDSAVSVLAPRGERK